MDNTSFLSGNSPLVLALKVALVILGGELSIMIAIDGVLTPVFGKKVPPVFWEFMDPVLLSIIVAPALYFFVLRPMRQQQEKLEEQKDELDIAAVTFNAQDGIIVTDASHTILKVNSSFTAITGYGSEEVVGKTPAVLQSGRQDKEFYRQMRDSLERKKFWQGEIWNRRKDGEIYPEWLTITAVTGERGNVHYVGIFSDITKRKAYEEKVNFMAYHDRLTELPGRELFYDHLSQAMSRVRRKQDRLALFFLDLDGFKAVNDNYGHEAGDGVLRATAGRLLGCIREGDTAARLGGDEFAILLGGIENSAEASLVAGKIIQKLSEPILLRNGQPCEIGVSIGIAIYPENGVEIDRLMSAADNAMYASKAGGKNMYTFSAARADSVAVGQDWIVLDKAYLLGIRELDEEHLELARVLNELNGAVMRSEHSEMTALLLNRLAGKIWEHFANEERLMDQYGYFDSDVSRNEAHKREHKRLIAELDSLVDRFNRGGEMAVLLLFKEWLLNHIAGSDRQLGEFISQKRGG